MKRLSLQEEHDHQYKLVHKRLSELVENAPVKQPVSKMLQEWEEAVLEEGKTGEAFVLYGLPPKTVLHQIVPENRIHEGRNPRLWTGEGSEQVKGKLYVIDVDQDPFEIAIGDDYDMPSPLNMALKHAWEITSQRFFTQDGDLKQPNNPECKRIAQGLLAATLERYTQEEMQE